MSYDPSYRDDAPTREEIDQSTGKLVLEFGADWCGHCQSLAGPLQKLFSQHPQIAHMRVADGRGKRLGRSYRVKLWPTFVFLHEGQVLTQLVRPTPAEMRAAFEQLAGA